MDCRAVSAAGMKLTITLLCVVLWLTWGDPARAQEPPPAASSPAASAPAASAPAPSEPLPSPPPPADATEPSPNDTAEPPFWYRVSGRTFSIEGTLGQRTQLGSTQLPLPGLDPPLIVGKAAYVVLPRNGLAVVDVGLARFPYLLWRLSPDLAVDAIAVEGQMLRVTTRKKDILYNIRDPLWPLGPDRFTGEPRRIYDLRTAAPGTEDQRWQEQGDAWSARGRRVYLHDGRVVLGTFRGLDTARGELTLDVLGQKRTLPLSQIAHVEPVSLGDSEFQVATRPGTSAAHNRKIETTIAVLAGVAGTLAFCGAVAVGIAAANMGFSGYPHLTP